MWGLPALGQKGWTSQGAPPLQQCRATFPTHSFGSVCSCPCPGAGQSRTLSPACVSEGKVTSHLPPLLKKILCAVFWFFFSAGEMIYDRTAADITALKQFHATRKMQGRRQRSLLPLQILRNAPSDLRRDTELVHEPLATTHCPLFQLLISPCPPQGCRGYRAL